MLNVAAYAVANASSRFSAQAFSLLLNAMGCFGEPPAGGLIWYPRALLRRALPMSQQKAIPGPGGAMKKRAMRRAQFLSGNRDRLFKPFALASPLPCQRRVLACG